MSDFRIKNEDIIDVGYGDSSKSNSSTSLYIYPKLFNNNGLKSLFSSFYSFGCVLIELSLRKLTLLIECLEKIMSIRLKSDY